MFFKKKEKIAFYNTLPGVEKTMPLISASNFIPDWKKAAAKEFSTEKSNLGIQIHSVSNCPGLNMFQSQGWIIRTWQDIFIESNHDNLNWRTPIDQKGIDGTDYIEFHPSEFLNNFIDIPENSIRSILKINTGWKAIIPKDLILHQLPIFYSNDQRFTALPGSYSSDYGIANLIIPIIWNVKNSQTVIEAGTPIAHLMLAPKKKYDYEILSEIPLHLQHESYIMMNNKFVRNYNTIKKYFSKSHNE